MTTKFRCKIWQSLASWKCMAGSFLVLAFASSAMTADARIASVNLLRMGAVSPTHSAIPLIGKAAFHPMPILGRLLNDVAATYEVFVAAAARATGAQGTNWQTDMMLYNPGEQDVNYTIYYTSAGSDGTLTPYVYFGALASYEAPILPNALGTLFSLANSAGSLRIIADGFLQVSSRTYKQTDLGTYGQFVPGQSADESISAISDPGELVGINHNSDYRTNIGFSEVSGQPAEILVTVYDQAGISLVKDFSIPIMPYSWVQESLSAVGLENAENVRVEVTVAGSGSVLSYASVVDNRTRDAICIQARKAGDVVGQIDQLVATIAKAQGGYGTNWRTDLYLYNPINDSQALILKYSTTQGSHIAAINLDGDSIRGLHDAVGDLYRQDESWSSTGNMSSPGKNPFSVLLQSGEVLVADFKRDSQLYDPKTETWLNKGEMIKARSNPSMILLPNGKVLVAGGWDRNATKYAESAELYDPAMGTWSLTGNMAQARQYHTATLLQDGKILVCGGQNGGASAELYDPLTGSWTATGSMTEARSSHTATLLQSGKVLVVGGEGGTGFTSAELYDPATGAWNATGNPPTGPWGMGLYDRTATLLNSGMVLSVGYGRNDVNSADLYDPTAGIWTSTGDLTSERAGFSATLLQNGKVLVVGGIKSWNLLSSAEIFDPATGQWSSTASLAIARTSHIAEKLLDGRVLVASGMETNDTPIESAELYDNGTGQYSAGSLHIASNQGLIITSRTFNQTDKGTYGQYIPAQSTSSILGHNEKGQILMIVNTNTYRCNAGFSEYSGIDTKVSVSLYDSEGNLIASTAQPVTVPANGNVQSSLGDLLSLSAEIPAGRIQVEQISGGSIYAYASVVDNRTGDAIFIPAQK